ncbi:MAG: phosphate ABC transporter permease PstA [Armatimonadota bacterium]|nr:phosphate ABC transporter permease PstA [bacterium]MDW8321030.1 phosphate ABC transporter permease PstA [Armatimonadota bacterium]
MRISRLYEMWRRFANIASLTITAVCAVVVMAPVFIILIYLLANGIRSVNWEFLSSLPKPPGDEGGGMANAIVGSFYMVGLGLLLSLPVGVGAGVYLAEFGRSRYGNAVRFMADVLNGVPSIVIGISVWALLVVPMRSFSALAGGVALSFIMIPMIARTTEEMVRAVPNSLRAASLSVGATYARTMWSVVLPAARGGIVTGVMLALARAFGEAAPLLFTALGNRFWNLYLDRPMANLPTQIYEYAKSPYQDWHRQAWAAALVLIAVVLVLNVVARMSTRERFRALR